MNKQQAIAAMKAGCRVTHLNFSPEEWMTIKDGEYHLEDGVICTEEEFWHWRQGEAWEDDYALYEIQPTAEELDIICKANHEKFKREWNENLRGVANANPVSIFVDTNKEHMQALVNKPIVIDTISEDVSDIVNTYPPDIHVIKGEHTPRVEFKTGEGFKIADLMEGIRALKYALTHKYKGSYGIAANQCSFNGERMNLAVFVMIDQEAKRKGEEKIITCINPMVITYHGVAILEQEWCLTWENNCVMAERYGKIDVRYVDEEGNIINTTLFSKQAQIFQHEVDHINGVVEKLEYKTHSHSRVKYQRNDPCPCGSGKKYKNCCINN